MDINEAKKFIQDKIETDKLTQKVRNVIKEKKWEKQDLKEGFKESFKPLIKPQQELNEQIKEQNELTNDQIKLIQKKQLALTEGLAANRLALTQGLDTIGQLLAIKQGEEDPFKGTEDDLFEDAVDKLSDTKPPSPPIVLNSEKFFSDTDIYTLENNFGLVRPNDLVKLKEEELQDLLKVSNTAIKTLTGEINGLNNKKNKTQQDKGYIRQKNDEKKIIKNYKNAVEAHLISLKYKTGSGVYFNNPHQLLNRLELLAGSILAGNNGVIPEFSQLVHFLNQINVISKKQLNDLLRNYLNIR